MKKTARFTALALAAFVLCSCNRKKVKSESYATGKIMSVTEAVAFVKASNENEGKEIIITAQNCGVLSSGNNDASLSLTDVAGENDLQNLNCNNFYATFNEDAVEYAKAVSTNATITVTGKIRVVNGKIRLEECKLIAQN